MADAKHDADPIQPGEGFNTVGDYGSDRAKMLFEQYKLYVDTTTKVSELRGAANTFLLSANTALVTVYGLAAGKEIQLSAAPAEWRWLIPLAGLLVCLTWFGLIRAYGALNTGKFAVIHEMERHLPVRLFDLEWRHLKRGRTWLYTPLSHVERIIPGAFGLVYLVMLAKAMRMF